MPLSVERNEYETYVEKQKKVLMQFWVFDLVPTRYSVNQSKPVSGNWRWLRPLDSFGKNGMENACRCCMLWKTARLRCICQQGLRKPI